ncbi:MAG: hypothetical protein RLZZ324_714 [Candidatus Parcubacteria bacterium]|jgi:hypothetical protein
MIFRETTPGKPQETHMTQSERTSSTATTQTMPAIQSPKNLVAGVIEAGGIDGHLFTIKFSSHFGGKLMEHTLGQLVIEAQEGMITLNDDSRDAMCDALGSGQWNHEHELTFTLKDHVCRWQVLYPLMVLANQHIVVAAHVR